MKVRSIELLWMWWRGAPIIDSDFFQKGKPKVVNSVSRMAIERHPHTTLVS